MSAPTPREAADDLRTSIARAMAHSDMNRWPDEKPAGAFPAPMAAPHWWLRMADIAIEHHARTTTRGDDRGRELAALAASWDENAAEERRAMGRPSVSVDEAVSGPYVADTWEQAASELRSALAAPAETEAGDGVRALVDRDEHRWIELATDRWWCLPDPAEGVDSIIGPDEVVEPGRSRASVERTDGPVREITLAATPPALEGEAVTELGRALRARMDELGLPDYADLAGFERHVRNGEGARVGAYVAEWIPGTPWATSAPMGSPAATCVSGYGAGCIAPACPVHGKRHVDPRGEDIEDFDRRARGTDRQ